MDLCSLISDLDFAILVRETEKTSTRHESRSTLPTRPVTQETFARAIAEGLMSEKSPTIGVGGIADRLIRRLRVSDPPERFQRRAASAAREALGVEARHHPPDRP